MNKSTINVPSVGTEADSSTTAENQQVSQPNANTHVVGNLFGQREIKFRAWDKVLNEFLPNVQNHINDEEWDFGRMLKNDRWIIMQYTGLKDKMGKDIYEGDIVKWSSWATTSQNAIDANRKTDVVKYSKGRTCFYVGDDLWTMGILTDIEVIGNVFENPELLQTLR